MTVLDASALLAYLQGEAGADVVEEHLAGGASCGAATWSEVAQKVLRAGDWSMARALLLSFEIEVEPVTATDAEWAARRWVPGEGLSLADRLCLALGARREEEILTADRGWGSDERIRQIR
ncbi:MAG: PIN domain-containing protein [Actinomycetota bacterium]